MYVARLWHGTCPISNSVSFLRFLDLEISGFTGCVAHFTKVVEVEQRCHIFVCTFWPSFDVLKEILGGPLTSPIDDPEDAKHGVISDPIVTHFETQSIANPFEISLVNQSHAGTERFIS